MSIRLLQHLTRGGTFGYFWHIAGRKSEWFKADAIHLPTGSDVYWGVHPVTAIPATNSAGQPAKPEAVRAQLAYIAAINCLFAEFDAKDFAGSKGVCRQYIKNRLLFQPSVIIDSGGGFHCYWLLDTPFLLSSDDRRKWAASLQARFVAGVGGDGGAKDLCRVLRVPGTTNTKYTPARPVQVETFDWTEYGLDDLAAWIEDMKPRQATQAPDLGAHAKGNGSAESLARFVAGMSEGQRNRALFWAANRALDKGMSEADVQNALLPAAAQAGLSEAEARRTIHSAASPTRRAA